MEKDKERLNLEMGTFINTHKHYITNKRSILIAPAPS